jgi:MFS family permease
MFALSTPWLVKRLGVATVMLMAMLFFLIGSVLLATLKLEQTYWLQTFISILVMPGAMNLSFPVATILISSALPKEKQGIAASLVSTMVNYCISCGLGLAGTIHRHSYERASLQHDQPMPNNPEMRPLLSASSPVLNQIRIQSFRGPWWFAVGLNVIGVLIASIYVFQTRTKKRS